MPEAAKNYSITELEMCGLAMNMATFSHLLKKVDFDAIVDHLAITHIMRSKAEPATTRIKRLLELLSPYSFNLYYIKRKDVYHTKMAAINYFAYVFLTFTIILCNLFNCIYILNVHECLLDAGKYFITVIF